MVNIVLAIRRATDSVEKQKLVKDYLKGNANVIAFILDPKNPNIAIPPLQDFLYVAVSLLGVFLATFGTLKLGKTLLGTLKNAAITLMNWTKTRYTTNLLKLKERELKREVKRRKRVIKAEQSRMRREAEKGLMEKATDVAKSVASSAVDIGAAAWVTAQWTSLITGAEIPVIPAIPLITSGVKVKATWTSALLSTVTFVIIWSRRLIKKFISREIMGEEYDPFFYRLPNHALTAYYTLAIQKLNASDPSDPQYQKALDTAASTEEMLQVIRSTDISSQDLDQLTSMTPTRRSQYIEEIQTALADQTEFRSIHTLHHLDVDNTRIILRLFEFAAMFQTLREFQGEAIAQTIKAMSKVDKKGRSTGKKPKWGWTTYQEWKDYLATKNALIAQRNVLVVDIPNLIYDLHYNDVGQLGEKIAQLTDIIQTPPPLNQFRLQGEKYVPLSVLKERREEYMRAVEYMLASYQYLEKVIRMVCGVYTDYMECIRDVDKCRENWENDTFDPTQYGEPQAYGSYTVKQFTKCLSQYSRCRSRDHYHSRYVNALTHYVCRYADRLTNLIRIGFYDDTSVSGAGRKAPARALLGLVNRMKEVYAGKGCCLGKIFGDGAVDFTDEELERINHCYTTGEHKEGDLIGHYRLKRNHYDDEVSRVNAESLPPEYKGVFEPAHVPSLPRRIYQKVKADLVSRISRQPTKVETAIRYTDTPVELPPSAKRIKSAARPGAGASDEFLAYLQSLPKKQTSPTPMVPVAPVDLNSPSPEQVHQVEKAIGTVVRSASRTPQRQVSVVSRSPTPSPNGDTPFVTPSSS
jgi:hypothetical protein